LSAVRIATRGDRAAVAAMLARAFDDDPVFAWMLPDPARRARALPRLFRALFDGDGPSGLRLMTSSAEAATLWRAPGRVHEGVLTTLARVPAMLATFGLALPRALAVANAIDAHMPAGDFWYLHIAGCDPAAQGRGLGAAAVRAGLKRAAGRMPCYLETAKERNLGFYRNLGWTVTAEWRVGDDGPRFWSMLRAPG
jgi:GNAT superfamily N-acetyltransferase